MVDSCGYIYFENITFVKSRHFIDQNSINTYQFCYDLGCIAIETPPTKHRKRPIGHEKNEHNLEEAKEMLASDLILTIKTPTLRFLPFCVKLFDSML